MGPASPKRSSSPGRCGGRWALEGFFPVAVAGWAVQALARLHLLLLDRDLHEGVADAVRLFFTLLGAEIGRDMNGGADCQMDACEWFGYLCTVPAFQFPMAFGVEADWNNRAAGALRENDNSRLHLVPRAAGAVGREGD